MWKTDDTGSADDALVSAAVQPSEWLAAPQTEDETVPPPPAAQPQTTHFAVAVVLVHPGPFLAQPPLLPEAVKFWPLVKVDLPEDQAAVLLDPETHKAVGAVWREWQEGDEPTADTLAAMARVARMARERRRCCGK